MNASLRNQKELMKNHRVWKTPVCSVGEGSDSLSDQNSLSLFFSPCEEEHGHCSLMLLFPDFFFHFPSQGHFFSKKILGSAEGSVELPFVVKKKLKCLEVWCTHVFL